MLVFVDYIVRTIRIPVWCVVIFVLAAAALDGPNVCMIQQKYNITKRIKYRAPMSVRTYEWCFAMPPRCSKWSTEIRDLTRFETEERAAEVAVCCPGYKMTDVACVPICPNGKTGQDCSEDCPQNKWGPNCANDCKSCNNQGKCSPTTGECLCHHGWKGESCKVSITTTVPTTSVEDILTNKPSLTKLLLPSTTTTSYTKEPKTTIKVKVNHTSSNTAQIATSTLRTSTVYLKEKDTLNTEAIPTKMVQNEKTVNLYRNETMTTKVKEISMESQEIDRTLTTEKVPEVMTHSTTVFISTTEPTLATTKSTVRTQLTSTPTYETSPSTIKMLSNTSVIISSKQSTQATTETTKFEVRSTTKPETTLKIHPTTMKFKPKEIWIRPAQKEPEHITAVMDKERERSSVDLISVISIAGGVMMAIITVAVVIVMIERCRRPRYEHVRKINDIRMQVMIDNNDIPPPYVRSIFHTPLPDPPSEKCHYQPISTLDRNLKQFMRPVVVQAISPIMLENFRDILECHYDHLPRRPQYEVPVAPSSNSCEDLRAKRASYVTDSAIEALKCEAKLDEIDSSNAEPLYAEIPCWRPPSEHAIEIMTVNGEAVTEL